MLPREVELVFFLSQIFAPKSEAVAGRRVDFVDVGQSFSRQFAVKGGRWQQDLILRSARRTSILGRLLSISDMFFASPLWRRLSHGGGDRRPSWIASLPMFVSFDLGPVAYDDISLFAF